MLESHGAAKRISFVHTKHERVVTLLPMHVVIAFRNPTGITVIVLVVLIYYMITPQGKYTFVGIE